MSDDDAQGGRGTAAGRAKVDRARLSDMADAAKEALAALRPGNEPPPRRTLAGEPMCQISVRL
jgi:hypothetical protein